MADDPKEPNAEDEFWEKFSGNLVATVNKILDERDAKAAKGNPDSGTKPETKQPPKDDPKPDPPAPGTSRTGGKRVTIPSLIADFMWPDDKSS